MKNNSQEIHNELRIEDMWEGLGGDFDNIQQILFEFIDNSISNLTNPNNILNNKDISISINVKNDNEITIQIEDTGTGIKNIDEALRIGAKTVQETTLNEHGFRIKTCSSRCR